ncbi:MFS transporter [Campylobacter sp. RM10532]|uniref:MFS transporter n=1 Tax=Campylobacter molothri TaxID=1032242 RepID=UPI001D8CC8CA|nr:MFS transporter [Campylobacter sp. RM10537]MBZ7928783.1 MFS transporter [Campylobacter sp. RM10542]MBZ7930086.1 MFS transporter [Campylobacter sp. W0067]MBZ7937798.1 MFS transporter [Campylobacter sp. RM10538]MBZ7943883.1 MFS transporter [Campylobacter sp. RM13744]MBZ7945554.1 MFS transporter [Campylobacter sp. RM10532]MBZ7948368.1 MFS transporter [Campylobacter sp. RM9929]MBZ7949637.1 MFS transporter [Campylobacter sp. RM10534]MBZ7960035.1 MFS transporter [Campylobacter sp. RM12397]MBZ
MLNNVLALSFIIGTRFFGLFIVLPVLSLYTLKLEHANEFLVGFLVGIYSLTQMILQMPFGILSDKIGRKKTMLIGLLIFIFGSLICAFSHDIYMMLLGRMLQGAGAIGGVATAMISDFITEENRGKAMAIMGSFIGLSFASSMVISPLMSAKWGLSSLFYLSAALSALCIVLLYSVVPKENKITHHNQKTPFLHLIRQKNLALMNITNCMQKMLMSIAFLSIPIILVKHLGFHENKLWTVYTPSMIAGFIAMGFAGSLGEKKGLAKQILLLGVVFFICSYILFNLANSINLFIIAIIIFFIGFNLHEPIMQSCASKFCKVHEKGAALGLFNAFGYAGSFIGGTIGGIFLHLNQLNLLTMILIVLAIFWLVSLFFLKNPSEFKNIYLPLSTSLDLKEFGKNIGVVDIYKNSKNLIIKFDSKITNEENLKAKI